MNKSLKRIRKRWLEYLLELVVITLGILGAFSLDNWNAERKSQLLSKEILRQIALDLDGNFGDMRSDADFLDQAIVSNLKIQQYIRGDSAFTEDLIFDLGFIRTDEYTYPARAGYDRLRALGMHIVKDDTIRAQIETIYEQLFPRISKDQSFHPDIGEYMRSYYQSHFRINNDTTYSQEIILDGDTIRYPFAGEYQGYPYVVTEGYIPLNWNSLKKDPHFMQLLVETFNFRTYKYRRYRVVIDVSEELIARIERELGEDLIADD